MLQYRSVTDRHLNFNLSPESAVKFNNQTERASVESLTHDDWAELESRVVFSNKDFIEEQTS